MVAAGSSKLITDRILWDARLLAASASTKSEVLDAINSALATAGVPAYRVSLEDYKRLVAEAIRANRAAGRNVASNLR